MEEKEQKESVDVSMEVSKEDQVISEPVSEEKVDKQLKSDLSFDIFLWANNTDGIKKDLNVELFLFNKHYTPYSTNFNSELNSQIKPLFLYDLINFVTMGAGTGLSVRDFELSDGEDNVLLRTDLEKVGRAETLIHLIETQRSDIVEFSEQEHEFKRIKGVLARFTHKDLKKPFYAVKLIQQGQVLNGATAWEFRDGKFGAFQAEVGLKMPTDNQVLIVEDNIFVYNQSKFERLFNYEYKKQALADQKVAEIEKMYKLSFPDELDLQSLVRDRKKIVNKLQKIEVGAVTQEQAIDYADQMQLEIMTDDTNAGIVATINFTHNSQPPGLNSLKIIDQMRSR